MKRYLASALIIGASTLGLVGCEGEKTGTEVTVEKTNPEGTTTATTSTEVKKDGENAPPIEPVAPTVTPTPDAATDLPK